MNTGSLYDELTSRIGRTRRKEQGVHLQAALLNTLAAALAVWTVAISLEVVGEFDSATRTGIYYGAVALCGLLAAWFLALPTGRYAGVLPGEDDDTIARRVGAKIPEVGDRLVNTLQLYRMMYAGALVAGYSSDLAEASIASQGGPLLNHDYTVIIDDDRRRRGIFFLLGSLAVMGGLFLGFPTAYSDGLNRLTRHDQFFVKPAPFTLTIEPGNRRLVRGDSVEIKVTATGIAPRTVRLSLRTGESEPDLIELSADSTGAFRHRLAGIKGRTIYSAASGPVTTPEYTIDVVERPEIRLLQVSVTSPAYTRRGTERLPDNMGDVSGIRGSSVAVSVTTNLAPARASIVQLFPRTLHIASASTAAALPPGAARFDTVTIPMKIDGTTLTGGFRLTRNGDYYISVTTSDGLSNLSPIRYGMSVSTDGSPAIALLQPTGAVDITEAMLLPTQVRISDDYGFSWLRIRYKVTASQYEEPWKEYRAHAIPIPKGSAASIDVPYLWNLAKMNMVPGDEVELYFEVADNDAVAGPKIARTGAITLKFPSLEEVLKEAEEEQHQATADLDKVLKNAQDARKEMEELNRELMKQLAQNRKQGSNWQEQEKLRNLMQQHEKMEQRLEDIAENLREMSEKLKEARAISPETLEKYQELQKLFQELKSPELRKAMEQMQKAMEKMTPEQVAEAMKNYKFNEEQFRQSIERTMKILERMQTEQKVDEMIRRAEEIAKKQEDLNSKMNEAKGDKQMQEQLAERQEQLSRSAEGMQQEAKELEQKMNKMGAEMPNKEMQEASEQLQQDNPGQQMDQAGEQMEKGDMQGAQQKGEQAKQGAQKFKEKMQGVKQKMQQNGRKDVMNKMRKAQQDLVDLSKRQEALKQQTENTQPNSQQFREQAQQEAQMQQDMQNIADQMGELSEKSFAVTPEMGKEMGDAMKEMQGATQSLSQREGFKAAQQQGKAMEAMNKAAQMMGQALGQMEGEGEGQGQGMGMGMGSTQQRIQEMAAQQQMINEAMRQQQGSEGQSGQGQKGKNGKNGKGEGQGEEGGDGEGEMKKLQQQQGQVKKSVEQLNKEMRELGGTRKNRVGDLERAAQEIEEVLSDMQSGQLTPETMQRQERILSRMLDALKSERERDFEKERESKPGVDVVRNSPGELRLPPPADVEKLQRDMIDARRQGYTKDYEYMIRRYFEALGKPVPADETR